MKKNHEISSESLLQKYYLLDDLTELLGRLHTFGTGRRIFQSLILMAMGYYRPYLSITERRKLFEAAKDDLNIIPAKLEDCMQGNMQRPSPIHPKRMKFEEDYKKWF